MHQQQSHVSPISRLPAARVLFSDGYGYGYADTLHLSSPEFREISAGFCTEQPQVYVGLLARPTPPSNCNLQDKTPPTAPFCHERVYTLSRHAHTSTINHSLSPAPAEQNPAVFNATRLLLVSFVKLGVM